MNTVIINRYNELLERYTSGMSNMGRLEEANAFADAPGCGSGRDHVYWYLLVEDEIVRRVRFQCHQCDPFMAVASDILAGLVEGLKKEEALKIGKTSFCNALGGKDKEAIEHFMTSKAILTKALKGEGV